jgi:hypothetical protein
MILWCQIQYGQKVSQNPIIHESEERACESEEMPERGACMIMGWMMIFIIINMIFIIINRESERYKEVQCMIVGVMKDNTD